MRVINPTARQMGSIWASRVPARPRIGKRFGSGRTVPRPGRISSLSGQLRLDKHVGRMETERSYDAQPD